MINLSVRRCTSNNGRAECVRCAGSSLHQSVRQLPKSEPKTTASNDYGIVTDNTRSAVTHRLTLWQCARHRLTIVRAAWRWRRATTGPQRQVLLSFVRRCNASVYRLQCCTHARRQSGRSQYAYSAVQNVCANIDLSMDNTVDWLVIQRQRSTDGIRRKQLACSEHKIVNKQKTKHMRRYGWLFDPLLIRRKGFPSNARQTFAPVTIDGKRFELSFKDNRRHRRDDIRMIPHAVWPRNFIIIRTSNSDITIAP